MLDACIIKMKAEEKMLVSSKERISIKINEYWSKFTVKSHTILHPLINMIRIASFQVNTNCIILKITWCKNKSKSSILF